MLISYWKILLNSYKNYNFNVTKVTKFGYANTIRWLKPTAIQLKIIINILIILQSCSDIKISGYLSIETGGKTKYQDLTQNISS